ncbi:thiamine-monophosphate kinase [Paenibacillus sp. PvR052]|nr:thiamine-monophosphate kinase [Paenibacillus sp. PvP091]MBP1170769.1 thiamine-monophosphate kinase [Paenibacillus sp. PvR098]MBP2441797.1 thiamine-monophosphate kinase [Paenibacillus sp. PvP052]
MSSIEEFALIRLLTGGKQSAAFQKESGVETGIGDDAAVVHVSNGSRLILTCDTMTEEIHFKRVTMRDTDVGYKAMASSVSDIAAMGGTPRFALIALSMPKGTPVERVHAMYEGLYDCASRYGVAIVGGDTTSSAGGVTLTVTVIGETEADKALLRSAARAGDVVFATGHLGRSAAGLEYLLGLGQPSDAWEALPELETYRSLVQAHCRPEPQVKAGELLRRSGLRHALNDVSDGLASEAWEIAEASGVGIDLIKDRIPVAEELLTYAMRVNKDPLDYILYGGEDYQLVGTAPAEHFLELQMTFQAAGLPLYLIGYVNAEHQGVRLVHSGGSVVPLGKRGYNHFGS